MSILIDYFLKPLSLFLCGLICIRLLGKKVLAEMNGLEIFAIFAVIDIIAGPLIQNNWLKAVLNALLFTALYSISARIKNKKIVRGFFVPSPTVLIRNGDILEKGLKKTQLSLQELMAMLRTKGYSSPADVEIATMEEIGQLSILPKSSKRPIEPDDLSLPTEATFLNIPVIMEGEILDHNLQFLNKDREWLDQHLAAAGLGNTPIKDITLAAYTQDDSLQIDTKKDDLPKNKYSYMPGNHN